MLRIEQSLGQVPFAEVITRIVRRFPECFSSRSILPTIESAQRFARDFPIGLLEDRAELERAWWDLEYWRNRFSTEVDSTYCLSTTNGVRSTDRDQVIRAVTKPYILASGYSGETKTTVAAATELIDTLKTPSFPLPELPIPSGIPQWVGWAAIGGLVLLFLRR